ncbi:MAG: peptide-methionine (S)-S-oxide reductase, partial [Deltaproteobacteria bacterium]|nr:peptide-methionine (S)-S-oxide reductase [Deltaproteobacteria bacterium]
KLARETRDEISSNLSEKVQTEIVFFDKFYMAEMYHQKYHLQGYEELMAEYRHIYPSLGDFVNSTSAARVNGFIGGYGEIAQFEEEFPLLGLSADKVVFLKDIIDRNKR